MEQSRAEAKGRVIWRVRVAIQTRSLSLLNTPARRAALGVTLGICSSLAALWLLSSRVHGTLRVVDIWPLLVGVGLSVGCWVLQGMVMYLLARPQLENIRARDMIRIYLAAAFVGGISPIRGAEIPYEVYLLRRTGLPVGLSGGVVFTRGMLNSSVVAAGSIVGLLFFSGLPGTGNRAFLLGIIPLIAVWGLVAWVVRRTRKKERAEGRSLGARITNLYRDLREGFARVWRQGIGVIAVCAALMIFYWALRLSIGPLALMAAGWSGNWLPVIVAQMILTSFIVPLVPTPGGSGGAELSFAALVAPFVRPGELLSGILIWRVLTYFLLVAVGAFFAVYHHLNNRGTRTG